jgi:D-alanyl-D-alanine carboxypeptidase (penicillin-binding protein 5/6)
MNRTHFIAFSIIFSAVIGLVGLTFVGFSFFFVHNVTEQSSGERVADEGLLNPIVAGVSQEGDQRDIPVSFESRGHAAEFRPIRKEGVYDLSLPSAHASVVMDTESGVVLQEKNAHERRQIASLTKLMTAMLVAERIENMDEPVTIDAEMIATEGTRVGCPRTGFCNGMRLREGERLTVRDLLKAALMNSANDAALALAKHISGSSETFVELMNARARTLGLQNTHFCTPSGLELDGRESECYSSAFDVARIASQALKHDILWELARTPSATIVSVDGKYSHDIFNTDVLLGEYPDLIGAKTGFTPLAGYSLLAISSDPERQHRVVSVVLNDPERWSSVKKMFAWAFQSHYWR